MQKRLGVGVIFGAHHENADNRKDNAYCRDKHRGNDMVHAHAGKGRAEGRCRQDGSAVRFVEVCAHARNVSDVIADVVGDGGGVSRIVFGNSRFDFTDQVCTDIGRLRVDTPANAGKERLQRGAHAKGQHGSCHFSHLGVPESGIRNQAVRKFHRNLACQGGSHAEDVVVVNEVQKIEPDGNV